MTIPYIEVTTRDNQGGAGESSAQDTIAVFGISTGATALLSAVTNAGTGGTHPVATVSGTPVEECQFVIDIEAGALTFAWSKDNGQTFEETAVTLPAAATDYALGETGVSIQWAAGTFLATHLYTFTAAPISFELYSEPGAVIADGTSGAGVELVADILSQKGKKPKVWFGAIRASVAGTYGVVKKTGTLTAPTLSGTPLDDYDVIISHLSSIRIAPLIDGRPVRACVMRVCG